MIFKTDDSQRKPLVPSYSEICHKHLMIKLKVSFWQQSHSCILHLPVLTRKLLHKMMTALFTSSNNITNQANYVHKLMVGMLPFNINIEKFLSNFSMKVVPCKMLVSEQELNCIA